MVFLGGQVLEEPGVVAGEARAVELLQRDVTELWQQVVAQVSLVDREGRLGELTELHAGVGPVVQPRRRVLPEPEALVRPDYVGAATPIDELGLHRVEGILLAGEAAPLDLLPGGCTGRGDIDREGPGEAAMSAGAAGPASDRVRPVDNELTSPCRGSEPSAAVLPCQGVGHAGGVRRHPSHAPAPGGPAEAVVHDACDGAVPAPAPDNHGDGWVVKGRGGQR
jgi:hypothetical protein